MRPVRRLVVLAVLALGVALVSPLSAGARVRWHGCATAPGFQCAVLRVPLDRSHHVRGTIALHIARQAGGSRRRGVLIALSGGPGQSAIGDAPAIAGSLVAAQRRYRIVVLDQRGTGGSGVLRCPRLQGTSELELDVSRAAAACARRLGANRADYSTNESVEDLEAVRRALGVRRIALQGISYGTYVAVQYARRHPAHVDRLVLDSVVGPGGVPALLTDSWSALPRVLSETCGGGGCRGITADFDGDVQALLAPPEGRALRGPVLDGAGRRRIVRLTADGVLGMVIAADLNPHLQAALPGAVRSALAGDPAPLVRLKLAAAGPPLAATDLSVALNVATTCTDTPLDYPLSSGLAERPARIAAAVAALPDAALGPLGRALVARSSVDQECRLWPPPVVAPPARGPLPRVPALVLSGRLDDRTPLENARAVAAQLPRAQLVAVPGTGHDETDSDLSGCVALALSRFFRDRPVGRDVCARVSNEVPPQPVAPTALARLAPEPGVPGRRGQVLRAAIGALDDAREGYAELADGGFPARSGGGLRAGRWVAAGPDGLRLRNVTWAPRVRVSGRVDGLTLGRWSGTLRVQAPGGLGGRLRFDARRGVIGVLGGRRVRLAARFARGAVQRSLDHAFGLTLARAARAPAVAAKR